MHKYDFESQISSLESTNARLSRQVTALKKERESFNNTQEDGNEELQSNVAELSAKIEELQRTKDNDSNTIKTLKDRLNANSEEFQRLRTELAETRKELAKGKLTTDPNNHTGEGFFYISNVRRFRRSTRNGPNLLKSFASRLVQGPSVFKAFQDWTTEPTHELFVVPP